MYYVFSFSLTFLGKTNLITMRRSKKIGDPTCRWLPWFPMSLSYYLTLSLDIGSKLRPDYWSVWSLSLFYLHLLVPWPKLTQTNGKMPFGVLLLLPLSWLILTLLFSKVKIRVKKSVCSLWMCIHRRENNLKKFREVDLWLWFILRSHELFKKDVGKY